MACLFAPIVNAAPWIETGNNHSRHSLQWLVDRGELNVPVTTWPVMWSGVAGKDLGVSPEARYLAIEAEQTLVRGGDVRLGLFAGNAPQVFRGYSDSPREPYTVQAKAEAIGSRFAAGASLSWTPDPEFDQSVDHDLRLDGSYLAASALNWSAGAGLIDRWWGPGWQSSLILSNNARPVPSVWLSRVNPRAPQWKWLSWVGPWQFVTFAGELEKERAIPHAKLLGARFSFRPLRGLEIGVSRTAQWGGEGRPESGDSLWNLIIGRDNRNSDGISEDNEPGNQLGAFDLRYGFALGAETLALYAQAMGEDEAGGAPSRWTSLAGVELTSGLFGSRQRWFLEGSDTTADSFSDEHINYTYEHGIYATGYRYRQRSLAASPGGDTRMVTLGMFNYFANGHELEMTLSDIDQNRDGTVAAKPLPAGINPAIDRFPENRQFFYSTIAYRFPLGQGSRLSLQGWVSDEELITGEDDTGEFGALAGWEYRF